MQRLTEDVICENKLLMKNWLDIFRKQKSSSKAKLVPLD